MCPPGDIHVYGHVAAFGRAHRPPHTENAILRIIYIIKVYPPPVGPNDLCHNAKHSLNRTVMRCRKVRYLFDIQTLFYRF